MNKIRLFFCVLCVVCGINSFAQGFDGGILGGVSASQIDGDGLGGYRKLGLVGGGFVNYKLDKLWEMQFEMRLMQKGAAAHEHDYKVHLNYIEIPFLLQRNFKDHYKFEAGLAPSVFMGGYNKQNGNKYDIEMRKVNLDVRLGAYYNISDMFSLSLQFERSIVPFTSVGNSYIRLSTRGHSLLFLLYMNL